MKKTIGILITQNCKKIEQIIDVSPSILARDWKGWNTYGRLGVLEIEKTDTGKTGQNA